MASKQKEHMEIFKELGFSVNHLTYEQLIDELIHRYIATSSACEMDDYERFKQELKRIKQPTN